MVSLTVVFSSKKTSKLIISLWNGVLGLSVLGFFKPVNHGKQSAGTTNVPVDHLRKHLAV